MLEIHRTVQPLANNPKRIQRADNLQLRRFHLIKEQRRSIDTKARSFCDMTISMLNPSFHCHKINFIYYKEGAFSKRREVDVGLVAAIEDEKERIREG